MMLVLRKECPEPFAYSGNLNRFRSNSEPLQVSNAVSYKSAKATILNAGIEWQQWRGFAFDEFAIEFFSSGTTIWVIGCKLQKRAHFDDIRINRLFLFLRVKSPSANSACNFSKYYGIYVLGYFVFWNGCRTKIGNNYFCQDLWLDRQFRFEQFYCLLRQRQEVYFIACNKVLNNHTSLLFKSSSTKNYLNIPRDIITGKAAVHEA